MTAHILPNPKSPRVALIGDTHANSVWTKRVIEELAADGVEVIVQLGDFGWWPQTGFAKKVSNAAASTGTAICFIDGNHENHEHLRFHAKLRNPDGEPTDPVKMYPGLWYLPRGCSWEWHGVRFRAIGGAFSIDHAWRTPGHDWFPIEEVPSTTDIERAIASGPADVLLCHDFPALGYLLRGSTIPEADERASRQVQFMLAKVVEAIEPKLIVHGHWHHSYSTVRHGITVKGLDCDGTDNAVTLLDLNTLQTEDWRLPVKRPTGKSG